MQRRDFIGMSHRAGDCVNRIASSARPGDLPIGRPARFALAINRKTAKVPGPEFSQAMLLRADNAIEQAGQS